MSTELVRYNDSVVTQANRLIESRWTTHMTEQEQKLLAFIISETKESDLDVASKLNQNKQIAISAKEFAEILNTSTANIYRDAPKLAQSIIEKSFQLPFTGKDGLPAWERLTIVTYMSYDSGVLTININSAAIKYLLYIKEFTYTSYKLENVLRLGSTYAIKIYQMLKQYEKIGQRKFSVVDLKHTLAIQEKKTYERYSQFKRGVLEVSKAHINEHTDIHIEYEEIKLGKSVDKIRFFIKTKQTQREQAIIGFEQFIKYQPYSIIMKEIWLAGQKDRTELINRFTPYLDMWISANCKSYSPNDTKPLNYESPGSLFYFEDDNKNIVKQFTAEYLKRK